MRDGFVYIAFTIYRLAPLTSLYRFHYEYLQSHWLRDTESTRDDMASAWLQNERKIELVAMADEAGMRGAVAMRKDVLVAALDEYLQANATRLSKKPMFAAYYRIRASMMRRDGMTQASDSDYHPARAPSRRTTRSRSDFDDETSPEPITRTITKAITARTPRSIQRTAQLAVAQLPLPASPAAVTDLVERQTEELTSRVSEYWDASGLTPLLKALRANLSTVDGVQTTILLLEAYTLQKETLPRRAAFAIPLPSYKVLGIQRERSWEVKFPDFFVLLTGEFWAPTTLWAITSVLLPMALAWLFNLTTTANTRARAPKRNVDPLAFNIARALVSWLIYTQGMRLGGMVADGTVARVDGAVPHTNVMAGAGIGVLVSLYEAILRK